MYEDDIPIEQLKSVSIRSRKRKMQLLLSASRVNDFQSFLKATIRNEVFVMNTNIGMVVYYLSFEDYSNFIKESALLFILKNDLENNNLEFENQHDGEIVCDVFIASMVMFSQYPQLFLAYSKKLLFLLKQNKENLKIAEILFLLYNRTLDQLREEGNLPHLQKINSVLKPAHELVCNHEQNSLIDSLAKAMLSKTHAN